MTTITIKPENPTEAAYKKSILNDYVRCIKKNPQFHKKSFTDIDAMITQYRAEIEEQKINWEKEAEPVFTHAATLTFAGIGSFMLSAVPGFAPLSVTIGISCCLLALPLFVLHEAIAKHYENKIQELNNKIAAAEHVKEKMGRVFAANETLPDVILTRPQPRQAVQVTSNPAQESFITKVSRVFCGFFAPANVEVQPLCPAEYMTPRPDRC